MVFFVYKINLQPNILYLFDKTNDRDYLITELIPNSLESIMEVSEFEGFFKLAMDKDVEQPNFFEIFEELEKDTDKLISMYNEILELYTTDGEIFYSKKFLTLNDSCGSKRRYLEKIFPGIKKAYEVVSEEEFDKIFKFRVENQVGTGITHIKKFLKLKLFIETEDISSIIAPLDLISYYNPSNEQLLVNTDKQDLANIYIESLTRFINGYNHITDTIGKVNINPVYEKIVFEGEFSEINYVIVYPNGNPPQNRDNILRESQAKEIETTLVGADGNPLKVEPIKESIEEDASRGYLKSLKTKGAKVVSFVKQISSLTEL